MAIVRYLTHPQVKIDRHVAVPDWPLNDIGRERASAFAEWEGLSDTAQIVSSAERKAIETAEIVGNALRVPVEIRDRMHENDRSATGFLAPDEFEKVADQFFANPEQSVRGWERAADAQSRIVEEALNAMEVIPSGDLLFVGHGGVGTLLYCHMAGLSIDRKHDQPAGGGNLFAFDKDSHALIHPWRSIEMVIKAKPD